MNIDYKELALCTRLNNEYENRKDRSSASTTIGGLPTFQIMNNNAAGCVVDLNSNQVLIIFEGSNDKRDYMFDAFVMLRPYYEAKVKGRVHSGFIDNWLALAGQLLNTITKVDYFKTKEYIVMGHSMGAAIATLCACSLMISGRNVKTVYALGSPRVGDKEFAAWIDGNIPTLRIVNGYDIVPTVPYVFMGGYRHTKEVLYVNYRGAKDAAAS